MRAPCATTHRPWSPSASVWPGTGALTGCSGQALGCARAGHLNHFLLELPEGTPVRVVAGSGLRDMRMCVWGPLAGRARESRDPGLEWSCSDITEAFTRTEKWMKYFSDDASQRNLRMCWTT